MPNGSMTTPVFHDHDHDHRTGTIGIPTSACVLDISSWGGFELGF